MTLPTLGLVSALTTATTYHFQTEGPDWTSWALCTVNDATGELLITSDWGNWAHRWDVGALGMSSLTLFIATREAVDYLAGKLQGRHGGRRFSAKKTVAAFRQTLCSQRFQAGRAAMQFPRRHSLGLTCRVARDIWDSLNDLVQDVGGSMDLFLAGLSDIYGFDLYVSERPFEELEYTQTAEDRALREVILPALIEACAETVHARTLARWFTPGPQPPEGP